MSDLTEISSGLKHKFVMALPKSWSDSVLRFLIFLQLVNTLFLGDWWDAVNEVDIGFVVNSIIRMNDLIKKLQ